MSSPSAPAEGEAYLEHEVVHYRQRFNWDCGVSCVLMLLDGDQRSTLEDNLERVCAEEGFGQVTWTIDLCYILKRYGIEHEMHTTMLGVNMAHQKLSYYQNILLKDSSRVTRRFAEAPAAGLALRRGLLSTVDIVKHLRRGPAIVLIDAGLLACDLCKNNKARVEFRRCFGGSFKGHFILLVGLSRGRLLFRDPAVRARLCATSVARLHRARPPPTDHDVILINRDYRKAESSGDATTSV